MKSLDMLLQKIQNEDKIAIYGAGEFASLLVQYCSRNGLSNKITMCIVTKKSPHLPGAVLGIPIVELEEFCQPKDIFIAVAVLSEKSVEEIRHSLTAAGYTNIDILSNFQYRAIEEELADFSTEILCGVRRLEASNRQLMEQCRNLSVLVQSMPLVFRTHENTFGKYKDINKGKTIVVCGSGLSLNRYAFDERFIHIGVNSLLFQDRIKLDYYFCQHIPLDFDFWGSGFDVCPELRRRYMESFHNCSCTKFIGQSIGSNWTISPPFGEIANGNYGIYYISDIDTTWRFTPDIRYSFLYGNRSIIFPALQFALFTNPKRIYIVGADGYDVDSTNYYLKEEDSYMAERLPADRAHILSDITVGIKRVYSEFNKFAKICYPETEIVMVNAKAYKGIFTETVTDEAGNIV